MAFHAQKLRSAHTQAMSTALGQRQRAGLYSRACHVVGTDIYGPDREGDGIGCE
jgi:hypothetical protein